jgi:effector-binding domain-containing protein
MPAKLSPCATLAALFCATLVGALWLSASARAQQEGSPPATVQTAPGTPAPSATPTSPAPQTPTPPATANPPANAPAASPAQTPAPSAPSSEPPSTTAPSDTSETPVIELAGRPSAYIEGKAAWDEGFAKIKDDFAAINAELGKANIKSVGHPIAVFTETDDTSFKFKAMVPIDAIPAGKTSLTDTIKFGETPAGKAMKFEHRGSYDDIDSTYEAITAFLDEKGLESQNLFYEEYLNDVKETDDPTLEVDIYVLLK